jgi:hypothetical protein
MQREDVEVVAARQPLDQPQQRRDHPVARGGIDASRHDQRYPHPVKRIA